MCHWTRFCLAALLLGITVSGMVGCGSKPQRQQANATIAEDGSASEDVSSGIHPTAKAVASDVDPVNVREQQQEVSRLLREKKYAEADAINRSLLLVDPESPALLFLAARIAHGQGQVDDAISYLRSIPPDHPEAGLPAMGQVADWLLESERLDEAESVYREMLERFGDLIPVHRRLAVLLNEQGRRVEASQHVRSLVRLGDVTEKELLSLTTLSVPYHDESDDEPIETTLRRELSRRDLARAKQWLVQGKTQEALQLVSRLRKTFPDSTTAAALQGRVYEALQRDDDLVRWVSELPSGIESEPEYWTTLGQWALRSKQPRLAVRAFGEAVLRDPTDRVAYQRMAEALAMSGEVQSAERVLQRKTWLDEAWQMALNVGLHRESRLDDLQTLADRLEDLGRPWEAVSWRTVLAYEQGRLEEAMPDLKQARAELASEPEAAPDLLCGVALADWPLPNSNDLASLAGSSSINVSRHAQAGNVRKSEEVFPIRMRDVAAEIGIDFQFRNHRESDPNHLRMSQVNGGGIAVIDFDLDGWADLYFCSAGGKPNDATSSDPNQLYRNLNGSRSQNVSRDSATDDRSYSQGATTADVNQDGLPDLLVANIGGNVLFINNGDGTFHERPILGSGAWTSSLLCGDLDGDALPEMMEINYINDDSAFDTKCWGQGFDCSPRIFTAAKDRFLKQSMAGEWTEWSQVSAEKQEPNYGFAGVLANFDRQSGNDLFLANDTTNNHFWVSQEASDIAGWAMTEQSVLRGCATGDTAETQGCMGIAGGDFDRDGTLDLFVTNYYDQPNNLFLQRTPGFFTDVAAPYGLADSSREMVGFGTQASDWNRDGWLDIAIVNGHVFEPAENGTPEIPFRMLPQLYRGDDSGFQLQSVDESRGAEADASNRSFWETPRIGRTLVQVDWDRDGKTDLVANSLDSPIAVLKNESRTQNYLRLDLVGIDSERDAIGAEVVVVCGSEQWHAWRSAGTYMGANERTVDIGIGPHTSADEVLIHWPSGIRQTLKAITANSHHLVIESQSAAYPCDVDLARDNAQK